MAVMDEFRAEREALKNGTPKEKLSYFWCYYKWHVIATVAIISCIGSFIYNAATKKETALYALMLNGFTVSTDTVDEYKQDFMTAAGIDSTKNELLTDTNLYMTPGSMDESTYNATQKIFVYVAAGEIDLLLTGEAPFEFYAYSDFLLDLRTIYTEEELNSLKPYLYYVDRKVIEEKDAASNNLETYDKPYPDPFKPEAMADPIPVGIMLDKTTEEFSSVYTLNGKPPIAGFVVNGQHTEAAKEFLQYITTGECDPVVLPDKEAK